MLNCSLLNNGKEMLTEDDNIIFQENSPWGNISAFVEDDGEAVYFYLYGPEGIIPMGESPDDWCGIRKCWVCNRIPVADKNGIQPAIRDMEAGRAPLMPAEYCLHASTSMELQPDQLEVVWFEGGDSAALLHEGQIISVIPPWACPSFANISGYARECAAPGFIGIRPLHELASLIEQHVERALDFWHTWSEEEAWQHYLNERISILEEQFGPHTRYFAIDGDRFPPRAIVVFEQDEKVIFITIGISILAQPRVELFLDEPQHSRRFEMGMAFHKNFVDNISITRIGSAISAIVAMPWDQLCWIGNGHTVDCNMLTSGDPLSPFDSVLMLEEGLGIPHVRYPDYRDPVTILWGIPICQQERQFLRENETEDLIGRLSLEDHNWVYESRKSTFDQK